MDRFVIRAPSWKTMSYASISTKASASVSGRAGRTGVTRDQNAKKKPLKERQLGDISEQCDTYSTSRPAELVSTSSDSGLSSASSVSPPAADENTMPGSAVTGTASSAAGKNYFGKLGDYVSCSKDKQFDNALNIPHAALKAMNGATTSSAAGAQREEDESSDGFSRRPHTPVQNGPKTQSQSTPKTNPLITRIQRDLNSPSAALRLRALKALKSPGKSAYSQFDVPEAEQSFNIAVVEPPSLEEIMREIVVYVDVRSGEDNRSAGVRKVIQALGARVNQNLLKDTTHVVFKDGLLSTYKKAKQWNIPVVSILWIEACKTRRSICDPKDYPISNVDRYENPELYAKMKRVKSMQPDSECNKRVRPRGNTLRDSPAVSVDSSATSSKLRKNSISVADTPTRSSSKKQTDISQFFKRRDNSIQLLPEPIDMVPDSPATQLLERINSDCYTPLRKEKAKKLAGPTVRGPNVEIYDEESTECPAYSDGGTITPKSNGVKKALDFIGPQLSDIEIANNKNLSAHRIKPRGRHSVLSSTLKSPTDSVGVISGFCSTPSRRTRRRSSVQEPSSLTKSVATSESPHKDFNAIPEEEGSPKTTTTTVGAKAGRYTSFGSKTIDICKDKTPTVPTGNEKTEENLLTESPKSRSVHRNHRRRTTFSSKMEISEFEEAHITNGAKKLEKEDEGETKKSLFIAKECSDVNSAVLANSEEDKILKSTENVNSLIGRKTHQTLCTSQPLEETPITAKTIDISGTPSNRGTPLTERTLLEEERECVTPLVFSSTRPPGRRRTLFDVSMDIITQRLQSINQSARRSLSAHPNEPTAEVRRDSKDEEAPITAFDVPNPKEANEGAVIPVKDATPTVTRKKRKLFVPEESALLRTPPLAPVTSAAECGGSSKASGATLKRRRTLMPIAQPQSESKLTIASSSTTLKSVSMRPARRSSMDFEQIPTKSSNISQQSRCTAQKGSKVECAGKDSYKQLPVLVHTNMHKEQIEVIREAVGTLGGFQLEYIVNEKTTHIVSLEPRRTLNLLRALARGLWILDYSWISESLKAGKWLDEEQYELQNFSRSIEICRAERQAFGDTYRCELFRHIGSFYISSNCKPISKENLREMIELCGGRIASQRNKAKYIIGDLERTVEDRLYVTPYWILDSITHMQIMKIQRYTHPIPLEAQQTRAQLEKGVRSQI